MALEVRNLFRKIRNSRAAPFVNLVPRFILAVSYYWPKVGQIAMWTVGSREITNFTYAITPMCIRYGIHAIALATGREIAEIQGFVEEVQMDELLRHHILTLTRNGPWRHTADERCEFGRRVFWYALARATKPQIIVETGVDKGLGSVVLCAALLRNCEEGNPGSYIGIDINPDAGWLLRPPYSSVGTLLTGDSIQTIRAFDQSIDMFVSDSDHSAEYEGYEYETVAGKISEQGLIVGDNAHVTLQLANFSEKHGRRFLFIPEQPERHWYPGSGVGLSLPCAGENTMRKG